MREANGWTGVIETGAGTAAIEPEETLEFENAGLYVYHNDSYDTTTFYPIFTIRMVRWHDKIREQTGPNMSAKEVTKYHERVQGLRDERRELEA